MNYKIVAIIIVLGFAMMTAFSLCVIGGFNNNSGLVTTGVGIITTAFGYVLGSSGVLDTLSQKLKARFKK